MAKLAKRFLPLQQQALTEAAIRYGGPESALRTIFDSTTATARQQAQAQDAGSRSLLGALQSAGVDLNRVYSDAGLSPSVLSTISNSPTGTRLAGELARAQAAIQQQQIGAQAGGQYQQQHIADNLRLDVGKINDQQTALATERGLFTQSLLDQLIGTDRKTRHDAGQHVKDQQFTADQNLLDNQTSQGNALIGQGIDPATGAPIPGAKSNKPKPKPKATPHEQAQAEGDFTLALDNAAQMLNGGVDPRDVAKSLVRGRKAKPGQGGKTVYEEVEIKDSTGKVIGKKRQPKLNPDGTVVETGGDGGTAAVDPVDPAIAMAAIDMATRGYLTPKTVKELHRLGYAVRGLPGVKTWADRDRPGRGGNPSPTSQQAPGAGGQLRPT